jgi:hypothetical protein
MKGVSFQLVAEILIALAAGVVILLVFQSFLPGMSGTALCKVYQVILSLPLPSALKPPIKECSLQPTMERIAISDTDAAKVTDQLANKIFDCWQLKADTGKSGITFDCYEIFISQINGNIKESDVTANLKSKNYCDVLPNNFLDQERQSYDCGNLNKIYWQIGTINGTGVTVIVKYDALIHRIEVI